uniref:Metalloendopeptidase n=1 Tax=Diabrotica virgifera virgifera TaxID=50390 RepID=A0A6P7HBQ8_DIAVI
VYVIFRFIRRKIGHNDYFKIVDESPGCFSGVGRLSYGKNKMNLGKDCFTKIGIIIHELMHIIGFWHEHSRSDRDEFVDIFEKNIIAGEENNFVKQNTTINFNQTYDYESVMHYFPNEYSKNDNYTIVPKNESFIDIIGQRHGLSKIDITKVNLMYNCSEKTDAIVNDTRQIYVASEEEYKTYLSPDDLLFL